MEKNGLAKASALLAVSALLVAAAALWSIPPEPLTQFDEFNQISELRTQISLLKDSIDACQAALETSKAKRDKLADRLDKLERQETRGRFDGAKGHADPATRDWFAKMGIDDNTVAEIKTHFKKSGLSDQQSEQALGGVLKAVQQMRENGEPFELDPRVRQHLKDGIGLHDNQIEVVVRIAHRLVQNLGHGRGGDERRNDDRHEDRHQDEEPAAPPHDREVF